VHSSTRRYRLSRVEHIFGCTLTDPGERLLLWLQLRLLSPSVSWQQVKALGTDGSL